MHRRTTALAIAAILATAPLLATHPARAQTVRLYLQRLAQRPAEILLVPGFLTILEFEDAVNAVATGNPAVVELVDVTGGTVMLRPRAGSGATDIVVSVSDVRALFRARVASQPRTTHKYIVTSSAPPEQERDAGASAQPRRPATQVAVRAPAPQPSPAPSGQTEWDRFVAGLNPAQQALLVELMREMSLSKLFAFLETLTPQQRDTFLRLARFRGLGQAQPRPTPAPREAQRLPAQQPPQAGSGPEWIEWQLSIHRTTSGTVLHYTLANTGQRMVLADVLRLRVTAAGQEVKFALTRVNPSGYPGRIGPGEAESGTIVLQSDAGGAVTLEWRVVEVGSGVVYTLTRTVQ
jgi:hypothetical protein